ncbi:MAG: hypothetical protein LBG27_07505 [Spirochaetaceae bacterium]|nr:hypothetical protein [Spirochaetaceae bacterium]
MKNILRFWEKPIALATSVDNIPNVRIVNFCFKKEAPATLYFTSDRENQKVTEFGKNNVIAFTSIPLDDISHTRSIKAVVRKSRYSPDEIKELFTTKIPGYDQTIEIIGESLDVFEIHVKEAAVTTGLKAPDTITL